MGRESSRTQGHRLRRATWIEINLATHDRVEARNQNTQFIKDPDAIVARAQALLSSNNSSWAELAVGLGVVTGRRISELLSSQTTLEPKTAFSVLFSGQLKTRGEHFNFEIPTLSPASIVLDAWKRLRFMLGTEPLEQRAINERYGRQCRDAANRHFADLIPPRHDEDNIYMHFFRAVYATIAVLYYCPPRVNRILFKDSTPRSDRRPVALLRFPKKRSVAF